MSREGKILAPSIVMILVSLLLYWLPGFGPLIAGYVGGRMAGNARDALFAALLPMVVAGIGVFVAISLFGLPVVGVIAGALLVLYIIALEIGLIAGAIIGGFLATSN